MLKPMGVQYVQSGNILIYHCILEMGGTRIGSHVGGSCYRLTYLTVLNTRKDVCVWGRKSHFRWRSIGYED